MRASNLYPNAVQLAISHQTGNSGNKVLRSVHSELLYLHGRASGTPVVNTAIILPMGKSPHRPLFGYHIFLLLLKYSFFNEMMTAEE